MRPSTWMLAGIAAATITCASGADFFPLREGNTWTYRNSVHGQAFTMTVGASVNLNDRTYYSLRGYVDHEVLVRLDDQQDLAVVDQETFAERKLISFQPSDTTWDAPERICRQEGQTSERRVQHDGPAGPIADVLEINYKTFGCADVGTLQEQFAENIGMVRRVNNTIAGPQTFDLVSATVNKLHIAALPNGSFSVAVDATDPATDVKAFLKLRLGLGNSLTLNFSSGQEYDVIVRDEAGSSVWTWSATRSFTQALHSRTVDSAWTIPVEIPRSVFATSGKYTIEGWLTTTDLSPHFGALVPLTIANPE